MEQVTKVLHSAWAVMQPWAQRNVTFGLVLAIITEVPRWTFAFSAAHEPIWAGCALAALMSYAAAHAWEEYFARHDRLLLTLNGLSLAFGVFTISPVIFAMTNGGGHSVDMKQVLNTPMLWAWSIVLASTTFLPLIQVAVVEVRRRERLQSAPEVTRTVQRGKSIDKPIAQPVTIPTVQEPVQPTVQEEELPDIIVQDGAPDREDKQAYARWLKMEKGMNNSAIGNELGVHRNTVSGWLNGASKVAV